MHQFDELLVGAYPPHHLGAEGFAAHLRHKVLNHREAHIGLQQGPPHFLEGPIHIGFADGPLAPKATDGIL